MSHTTADSIELDNRSEMHENVFKENVRRHFDDRADRYDNDTETWDQQDFANFETVIPYVISQGGNRILEVATGTGIVLDKLLSAGMDACGLDLSAGLLRVAEEKRRISKERLYLGDAEKLPFPDKNFESICVFRSLHHMDNQAAVLAEMSRCARKNIFVYDSAGGWRRRLKSGLTSVGLYQFLYSILRGQRDSGYRPANETEGPVKVFYVEDAVPILRDLGMRIVSIQNYKSSWLIHAQK
jgi:SAM-dependent methyltransferase